MLLLLAVIFGTAGGLWHGGALRHFARIPFRWPAIFLVGLVVRGIAFSPLVPHNGVAIALYVAAIGCLIVGIALNRRVAGIELVLLGLILNAVVILANGGSMPVSSDALRLIGRYDYALELGAEGPLGHAALATPETVLRPLADIIPLSPLPFFQTVASVGDLFIAAGVLVIFYAGTLRPFPRPVAPPSGEQRVVPTPVDAARERAKREREDIPA